VPPFRSVVVSLLLSAIDNRQSRSGEHEALRVAANRSAKNPSPNERGDLSRRHSLPLSQKLSFSCNCFRSPHTHPSTHNPLPKPEPLIPRCWLFGLFVVAVRECRLALIRFSDSRLTLTLSRVCFYSSPTVAWLSSEIPMSYLLKTSRVSRDLIS